MRDHSQENRPSDKAELKNTIKAVYAALVKKGYNPVNQIVGYILSEDPTYITTYNNARNMIRHIDRDELLQELVRCYLDIESPSGNHRGGNKK
jgi:YD repeat-containing protein